MKPVRATGRRNSEAQACAGAVKDGALKLRIISGIVPVDETRLKIAPARPDTPPSRTRQQFLRERRRVGCNINPVEA